MQQNPASQPQKHPPLQVTLKDDNLGETQAYAVDPKTNCPHLNEQWYAALRNKMEEKLKDFVNIECIECQNKGENWICLQCLDVFCSRYIKGHMVKHNEATQHPVTLSFADGSFWCYQCDDYVTNKQLTELQKVFSCVKHQEDDEILKLFKELNLNDVKDHIPIGATPKQPNKQDTEEKKNDQESEDFEVDKQIEEQEEKEVVFTREQLVEGVKQGKFKNVCFMVGAGISVSAGIPDFRTPGTGLYSQLEKYNLPYPEAVFTLSFFKEQPKPFYVLSKEFQCALTKPTVNHYFMAEFEKKGFLQQVLTQNIDGLEISGGVSEGKCVQAHGHYRSAHCTKCQKVADIKKFEYCVEKDEIHICECGGYVKPDIVFFGEQMPLQFFLGAEKVSKCDLAIIMGTSLKVHPFAALSYQVPKKTPLVLINRENPGVKRENFLFLEGNLDDNIEQLMSDFGWQVPKVERKDIKPVDFSNISK